MIHILGLFLITASHMICSASSQLIKDAQVAKPLQELMRESHLVSSDVPNAVLQTQRKWLRKPGLEREDLADSLVTHKKKETFLKHFKSLGLMQEVTPKRVAYTHMLIMGNYNEGEMRKRLLFAKRLYEDGVRAMKIAILSSSHVIEDYRQMDGTHIKRTEIQMVARLLRELGLDTLWQISPGFEKEIGHIKEGRLHDFKTEFSFIVACPKKDSNALMRRPTTEDTIRTWFHFQPEPGHCLVVSNQPFVQYQTAVARWLYACEHTYFKPFCFEGVGPEAKALPVATYLDTIARQLYNEAKLDQYQRVRSRL